MHDPRIGRFFAVDPLIKEYPYYSSYAFSGNRVIDALEIEGLEPEVLFSSVDAAAENWGLYYGDNSIRRNREYGSDIYKVVTKGKIEYAYAKARVGEESMLPITSKYPHGTTPSPDGKNAVAWIHSHGNYDEKNTYNTPENNLSREFSGRTIDYTTGLFTDKKNGKEDIGQSDSRGIPGYLVTFDGNLQKYDPSNSEISLISTQMPHDPNDPITPNNVQSTYENFQKLGSIEFNSDKAVKRNGYFDVVDIKSQKTYQVYVRSKGVYGFYKNKKENDIEDSEKK